MIGDNVFRLNQETICHIVESWFNQKMISQTFKVTKVIKTDKYFDVHVHSIKKP